MYVDLIEEADLAVETLAPLIEAALPAVRQAELDPRRPDAYWAELYDALTDYDGPFDPVALTDAIWKRFDPCNLYSSATRSTEAGPGPSR